MERTAIVAAVAALPLDNTLAELQRRNTISTLRRLLDNVAR